MSKDEQHKAVQAALSLIAEITSDYQDGEPELVEVDEGSDDIEICIKAKAMGLEKEVTLRTEDGSKFEIQVGDDVWEDLDDYSTNVRYFWIEFLWRSPNE